MQDRISVNDAVGLFVVKFERRDAAGTLRFVSANPACHKLTGIEAQELVGRTADEVLPELRATGFIDLMKQALVSGMAIEVDDFQLGNRQAPRSDWTFSVFPLPDDHLGIAIQDVAGRRKTERQSRRLLDELAHLGRISTMGEMATGLAHELNQPLAAIVAYVDACQELVESGKMNSEQLADVLRAVAEQAERAGQIIHRLRRMIKRNQPVRSLMSVNDAVREVAVLLGAEARQAGVTVQLELADDLLETAADFLQVQQVVLNLMRNGLEAMTDMAEQQRKLTIATRRTPVGDAEIAVADVGHGLAADSAERAFEPFFTTKANGLGLGLSISRTIVEAHGGRIWITPNSARGVTARFTLPSRGQKADHDSQANRVHR